MIGIVALMAVAIAATPASAPGQTPSPRLTSYDETVRCAGLTQAASELEGGESTEGRTLYDAALFWSLAALQAGHASGRSDEEADADQTRARVLAVRQLTAGNGDARAALARCVARTPDLG